MGRWGYRCVVASGSQGSQMTAGQWCSMWCPGGTAAPRSWFSGSLERQEPVSDRAHNSRTTGVSWWDQMPELSVWLLG